ncbi:hypothetical protein EVAR_20677_1 [Eumeta japonica]|uniref:Uncharacterized protein n=1 Tax=Eumeta variegata TaxID=151549 RepID=A0A4C1VBH5_EUMVA|nr:hypothetical protein EVAR_20677_1 [Eumeta japonica]
MNGKPNYALTGWNNRRPISTAVYTVRPRIGDQAHVALMRNLQKLWARTRCPRIKRELNHITQDLRQAVWTFRGAAWEETIEQAGEDWK